MKRDMYIDYNRSFKRRGRKRGNKAIKAVLGIILVLGLGFGSYYAISAQINTGSEEDGSQELKNGEQVESGQVASDLTEADMDVNGASIPGQVIEVSPTPIIDNSSEDMSETRVPVKVRGIYVTGNAAGTELKNELIETAETTEINAMVIDVKNDEGRITYSMDSAIAKEIGAITNTVSDMESLIKTLKEKNIYLIARVVAFKDPFLANHRKDLALLNKDGSYYKDNKGEYWVNPYQEEVWDYLIEVATQAAAIGFEEIQFDYIRFPTGGTIAQVDYKEDEKIRSKEEVITDFTKYVYEKLKPLGVFVSADVYGTIINSSVDAGLVGQNYVEMSKHLDYICPMIYPSHYAEGNYGIEYPDLEPYKLIRKALLASKTELDQIPEGEHRAIVRPWLQDFTATWLKKHMKYGGPEVRQQIGGVYAAGYEEWLLWNASCKYSVKGLEEE